MKTSLTGRRALLRWMVVPFAALMFASLAPSASRADDDDRRGFRRGGFYGRRGDRDDFRGGYNRGSYGGGYNQGFYNGGFPYSRGGYSPRVYNRGYRGYVAPSPYYRAPAYVNPGYRYGGGFF